MYLYRYLFCLYSTLRCYITSLVVKLSTFQMLKTIKMYSIIIAIEPEVSHCRKVHVTIQSLEDEQGRFFQEVGSLVALLSVSASAGLDPAGELKSSGFFSMSLVCGSP